MSQLHIKDGADWIPLTPAHLAGSGGSSGGLTDAQLRAAPVPVSGPLTDAQLRAAPVAVGGVTVVPIANFNRPADTTAYAVGDLVANTTVAAGVAPMQIQAMRVAGGGGILRRLRLRKSSAVLTNAQFRVHLFAALPTGFANGDNGAFSCAGAADYIGRADITIDQAFTDGACGSTDFLFTDLNIRLPAGQLVYAVIEARAAYTPASSETFALRAEMLQD